MELHVLTDRAREIRSLYEDVERDAYGRSWSLEELALGLVGDIGDLAKLLQAREGVRKIDDVQTRLEHELAGVLWATMVIAEECGVELERAFLATMDQEERKLGA
jgi:NTP pyrophosphatase (non-canonical NTP hydrolase)